MTNDNIAMQLKTALKQGKAGGADVAKICAALMGGPEELASATAALACASRECKKKQCTAEPALIPVLDGAVQLSGVHLPEAAIVKIFATLEVVDKGALAVANTACCQASRDPSCWVSSQALSLPKSEMQQNPTAVLSFLKRNQDRFAKLSGIQFPGQVPSTFKPGAKFLKGLGETVPSLRYLDTRTMLGAPADDKFVDTLGRSLGAKLNVFRSGGIHNTVHTMHSIAKHFKVLEILDMRQPYRQREAEHREMFSRIIIAGCKSLRHLVFPRDDLNHRMINAYVVDVTALRAGESYSEEVLNMAAAYAPINRLLASWAQEEEDEV
jgi:hypothetical protein